MRFAILGLWHETNTFSSVPADYAAFESDALLRGDEIVDEYRDSESTVAGFLEAARHFDFEAVPLVHARTGADRAFDHLMTIAAPGDAIGDGPHHRRRSGRID